MTNVVKEITLNVQPKQFFTAEAIELLKRRESVSDLSAEENDLLLEQINLVTKGFGTDSIEDEVTLVLKMEDFLFDLFQLLEVPSAPLRKVTHHKYITGIAEVLSSTINDPSVLPSLVDADLSKIKHFIDNDEEFNKLEIKFHFIKKSDGTSSTVPLNPKLLGVSVGFITTLAALFKL